MAHALAFVLPLLLLAWPAAAGTYTVTKTSGVDAGTFRHAVDWANGNPGPDEVRCCNAWQICGTMIDKWGTEK